MSALEKGVSPFLHEGFQALGIYVCTYLHDRYADLMYRSLTIEHQTMTHIKSQVQRAAVVGGMGHCLCMSALSRDYSASGVHI